ncbi:hypothetical protein Ahy_B08g093585 [Arachis hypogaea]|uniref:FAR1 domain-containing protein n=1 Tax=Arachis hypogaea TaxID=3818 RepID=A0A444Y6G0_ARAHY|nr:hypothetical protein Ahy_B08g093585 [Arachis hypogaea]
MFTHPSPPPTLLSAGLSIHRCPSVEPSPLPSNPSSSVVRRLSLPVSSSLFSLLSSLFSRRVVVSAVVLHPPCILHFQSNNGASDSGVIGYICSVLCYKYVGVAKIHANLEASNSQRHISDQNVHNVSDHVDEDVTSDAVDMDQYRINSWEDIGKIDFSSLSMKNICQLHFADLGLAFEFYNSYAKKRGFSVRKSRSRIVDGKVREKVYVCSCEGYRLEKWNHMKNRVREPKPETRCGCMSKLHVFFDAITESWVVRYFCDEHNHDLVVPKLARMLRSHKQMTEPDISQMNHMKEVGISIPNIFGSLASQCGDYEVGVFEQKWEEMVGFFGVEDREWIVDMYGKRNIWATAHIRGKFFVGFRTTSRYSMHILAVLDFLDIAELPKSLVLRRWTRKAKEGISGYDDMGGLMEDSLAISRRACLAHWCKQIMNEGCLKGDLFNESRDALVNILSCIRAHSGNNNMIEGHAEYMYEDLAKNGSTEIETTRKPKRCSYYRKGVITLLRVP